MIAYLFPLVDITYSNFQVKGSYARVRGAVMVDIPGVVPAKYVVSEPVAITVMKNVVPDDFVIENEFFGRYLSIKLIFYPGYGSCGNKTGGKKTVSLVLIDKSDFS
jgi:hypothetical protein